MAPTRLPSSVRIGPVRYRITEDINDFHKSTHRLEAGEANGVCDNEQLLIVINPEVDPQYKRTILMHEIIHACFSVAGQPRLDDQDANEERFIQSIDAWLVLVLRDNPRVLAYILEV